VLTGSTIPGLTAPVTVQYDAEDIPHINCATTIDCLAVQGYIQARDRFFPMDFLRHVARAHLSELIGIAGLEQDVQLRTLFVTRAGHRLEDDLTAVMATDATTTALVQAFVNGVNAYLTDLKSRPGNMPGEYAQLPFPLTPDDIAPWTIQDTLAMARLQQFQLSETIEEETGFGQFFSVYGTGGTHVDMGKVNTWIRAAAPKTERAHTLAEPTFRKAAASPTPRFDLSKWQGLLASTKTQFETLRNKLRPSGASVGSNNWVVSGAMSGNHAAMVANDPHLSLQYPPLFHLSVMTSATATDNLNLAGGAFPGIPGALVGRGAHVGWGVTVVGYDVTDVYLETFAPQASCPGGVAGPPCVVFKGGVVSTVPAPQSYKIRVGPGDNLVDSVTLLGAKAPPQVVLIVPHHGPIIQAGFIADGSGKGVSVRWTGHEGNTQDVKAILGLNTAADVDAAVVALKLFATGAQNFVLADDQGHIAYDPHALVPVRRWTTTAAAALAPPWFPVPGDGAAIDVEWGDGASNCASATLTPVPATCWIADAALPFGKDPAKGYFFTANADPTATGVSDDNSPLSHPPYLSFDWDDSTGFRATRINELLSNAITTNGSVSLTDMEAIQADHVSRPGKVFTDIIATLPTNPDDPADLVAARAVLSTWATNGWDCPSGLTGTDPVESPVDTNATTIANSSGCFLFHEFLRVLLSNVFTDDLSLAGQGVNGLQALKGMIYM
ncbi:MAG TPA: penicillin acylase family protein, partial [Kofleriaceae bacterium]|nr:penicillin acylase family protein [Kofleriaceae bacterium]